MNDSIMSEFMLRLWPVILDHGLSETDDFEKLAQEIERLRTDFGFLPLTPPQYYKLSAPSKITEELWCNLSKNIKIITKRHFTKAGAKFLEMFKIIYRERSTPAFVLADAEAPGSSVYAAALVFGWSGEPHTWPVAVISLINDQKEVVNEDKRFSIQYENANTMKKVDFKGDILSSSDQAAIEVKFAHKISLYTFDGGFAAQNPEEEYAKKKQFFINAAKRACKVILPGGCAVIKTFLLDKPTALIDGARYLCAAFKHVEIMKPPSSFVLNREIYVIATEACSNPPKPPSVEDFIKTDKCKAFISALKQAQLSQIIAFNVMLKEPDPNTQIAKLNDFRRILSQKLIF